MATEKACTKCGEIKSFDGFYPQFGGKYRYTAQCKTCLSSHQNELNKQKPKSVEIKRGQLDNAMCQQFLGLKSSANAMGHYL